MSATLIAQDAPLWTVKFENAPLPEVLAYLESTYNVSFAFDAQALSQINVTIDARDWSPQKVLDALLEQPGWAFKQQQGNYVIIPNSVIEPSLLDISCKLYDAKSGEALPFANIWVPSLERGTTSNVEGYFSCVTLKIPVPWCCPIGL